jgi:hypothetical protein
MALEKSTKCDVASVTVAVMVTTTMIVKAYSESVHSLDNAAIEASNSCIFVLGGHLKNRFAI